MLTNQINLNSLDIQQARIKYILFKSKLRSVLYGSPLDATLLSPRENALGKWIYTNALQKYGHIPEVKELEYLHLAILRQAGDLVNLYNRNQIEEARKGLENLDKNEEELIRLLGVIAQKLAS